MYSIRLRPWTCKPQRCRYTLFQATDPYSGWQGSLWMVAKRKDHCCSSKKLHMRRDGTIIFQDPIGNTGTERRRL
jgi:hypothetical protein